MVFVIKKDLSQNSSPNEYYNVQYGFIVPNKDISATLFYVAPYSLCELLQDQYTIPVIIEIIHP